MPPPPSPSTAKPWSILCRLCTVSPPRRGGCIGPGCVFGGGRQHPGGGQFAAHPVLSRSFPTPDESDARRKEAIRAKVSQKSLGRRWGQASPPA